MRKVVLETVAEGYHCKIEQVPVLHPGDHEVLVRVHAVSSRSRAWHLRMLAFTGKFVLNVR